MCVILVGKIGHELHERAKAQNKDGFSLFTKELGLIKAPSKEQVDKAVNQFGIWHYRIASSGKVDKNNIHPFRVCKSKYLLYHNGVLGEGTKEMSDTACLAETLYNAPLNTVKSVLRSLSSGNRFLLVNAYDPTEYYLYGDWACMAGVLCSHKVYDYSKYSQMSFAEQAGWGKKYPKVTRVSNPWGEE